MEDESEEPFASKSPWEGGDAANSPAPVARPCSTPHPAPVGWPSAGPLGDEPPPDDAISEAELDRLAALALQHPDVLADAISRACPEGSRKDGWSSFARRLFLQVMAETGRVTLACE